MSSSSWRPTKTYSKNLWVMFSGSDEGFKAPLGIVESREQAVAAIKHSAGRFKGMQLRKYAKFQPGKAERALPLELALEEINNKNGFRE